MNDILQMRTKRAELWDKAKTYLDEHRDEQGNLSAEDSAAYDRMEGEIITMGRTIDRLERAQTIENEMNSPINKPITVTPAEPAEKKGRAGDEYNKAFWDVMRTKRTDLDRSVFNALAVGTDSEGGYLAPDEYENTLVRKLEEQNVVRSLATVIRTESGELKIPVLSSGGEAKWTAEGAAYNESDMVFAQVTLSAYKLTRTLKVSEELANDSAFDLGALIADDCARAFGAAEEKAFIEGTGVNEPTGILAATGGIQDFVTAAGTTAVTFDEVFELYYALRAPYRKNAVWLTNDATVKLLRKIKDGNQQYIWQPAVTAGTPDLILGRPVYTSPYMPAVAAGKVGMVFGDFGYYWIADRQARNFRRLDELYAATGQVGFISRERVDGKLVLPEALKGLKMAAS